MTTFDYAAAWRHAAAPAFTALPREVHELLARVTNEAAELNQLPDQSMPWPTTTVGPTLRAAFDAVPSDVLALAARAVYCVGHWFPVWGTLEVPGRNHGSHWKFSHYADQVLRGRLQLPENGGTLRGHSDGAFLLAVIEGAIRLQYSSRDMWTWEEIAPATVEGLRHVEELRTKARKAVEAFPPRERHKRDGAAYDFIQGIKTPAAQLWPGEWWPQLQDTARYMVEEGDQEPPPPDPEGDARKAAAARQRIVDAAAKEIRNTETKRDGKLWFLDRGIPIDNLIFYDHTGVFTFGWYKPVGPALLSRILDIISEFPYPYAIKTHDKRTLEGGQG